MNKSTIERIAESIDHFDEVEVIDTGFVARFSAYDSGIKERSSVFIPLAASEAEAVQALTMASAECNINIYEFRKESA